MVLNQTYQLFLGPYLVIKFQRIYNAIKIKACIRRKAIFIDNILNIFIYKYFLHMVFDLCQEQGLFN